MAKIVIIDTDTAIAAFIAYALQRDGHRVVEVSDLALALPAIADVCPELIVLSAAAADTSSLDICRSIRSSISAPMLLYNGLANEEDEIRALDKGVDAYMPTPLDVRLLRARARALLRRAQAVHPPRLATGRRP